MTRATLPSSNRSQEDILAHLLCAAVVNRLSRFACSRHPSAGKIPACVSARKAAKPSSGSPVWNVASKASASRRKPASCGRRRRMHCFREAHRLYRAFCELFRQRQGLAAQHPPRQHCLVIRPTASASAGLSRLARKMSSVALARPSNWVMRCVRRRRESGRETLRSGR